jgi:Na+/H+ antiporter NhaD/arsenite permease-like protein
MNDENRQKESFGLKSRASGKVALHGEKLPPKLSARNYFEIVTSFLFFFLGLVILVRSIAETGLILGMGVGAAFLAFGFFRLRVLWNYFLKRGQKV